MTVDALSAAKAYGNQVKMMQGQDDAGASDESGQPDFAKMVGNALNDAVNSQSNAESLETQSMAGGKVELSSLVTAVANAELSLDTIVAVRDRVINAYNDIIKMAI